MKSIIDLTDNLECITPEKRTNAYNEFIKEVIENTEKIEIEKQKEKEYKKAFIDYSINTSVYFDSIRHLKRKINNS